MPLVISYDRVSKTQQANGQGLARQRTDAERYADRMGWVIDESLSFSDPGMSAFRSKHAREGAFAGFLAAVRAGVIKPGTILIVEHLDRLSRDKVRVARDQFEALLDAGVQIVTTSPERHYTKADLDDVIGLIEPLLLMARAHEESLKKSDRLKKRFASDRVKWAESKSARGEKAPAWLRLEEGKYVCPPSNRLIIGRIFSLSLDGMGVHQIARKLNGEGVKSFGKSGKWNTTYLQNILGNRAVLGEMQPHQMKTVGGVQKRVPVGNPIPGYYPAVVDAETWHRSQGAKAVRTKARGWAGNGVPNLFTGIIFDQHGSSLQSWTKSNANKSRYLTSSTARARGEGAYVSFPYEMLEGVILRQVIELKAEDLAGVASSRATQLQAMEEEVNGATARIGKLTAMLAAQDDPAEELVKLVGDLNTARKAMVERLEAARGEAALTGDVLGETKSLIGEMGKDVDKRRRVKAALPRIIERITMTLTRTTGRAVLADVDVKWKRGDVSHLTLHSRGKFEDYYGPLDRSPVPGARLGLE